MSEMEMYEDQEMKGNKYAIEMIFDAISMEAYPYFDFAEQALKSGREWSEVLSSDKELVMWRELYFEAWKLKTVVNREYIKSRMWIEYT